MLRGEPVILSEAKDLLKPLVARHLTVDPSVPSLCSGCLRGAPTNAYERSAWRRSSSCCPRRMEHHSLCSATGMPHSTQTRMRWVFAGVFDEKSRFRNDIYVSGSNNHASSLRNERRPGYTGPGRTRYAATPWLDRRIRRRVGMAPLRASSSAICLAKRSCGEALA